ncbi:MAG TPA: hypothetical protein VK722_13105 [Candidatus Aquilonibacter sp.]|nr:hypothetical protein [Candidatus Aquilonibacter sp.]
MASGKYDFFRELDREFDEAESEFEWDDLPSVRRRVGRVPGESEWFTPEPSSSGSLPRVVVHCGGCANCESVVRSAVFEAIHLANAAAGKLEVASVLSSRERELPENQDAKETARLFRAFFCHDPSRKVPVPGNVLSGLNVARRLRSVAKELGGGRTIFFECLPALADCADGSPHCCGTGEENARSVPETSTIGLCPQFFTDLHRPGLPDVDRRAGTIIHESLHLFFASATGGILDNDPKRANAHCYKAFVLRVNRFGGDPLAVGMCGHC